MTTTLAAPNDPGECNYCGKTFRDPVRLCTVCGSQWCPLCLDSEDCPECNQEENEPSADEGRDDTVYRHCPQCITSTYSWKETTTQEVRDPVHGSMLEKTVETLCITCGYVHETQTTKEAIENGNSE